MGERAASAHLYVSFAVRFFAASPWRTCGSAPSFLRCWMSYKQQQLLQQCCTGVVLPALQGKETVRLHQLVARLGLQDIAGRRGVISLFCALYQQMQEHGLQPRYASLACAVGAQQGQHCIAQVEQALVQLQQQHVKQVQDAWKRVCVVL